MLKEALSMILGPCLIFCRNYIQRKLKRCFSRAKNVYAYTPLASPLRKTWTLLQVLYLVWFGAEEGINCLVSTAELQKAPERQVWRTGGESCCHLKPLSQDRALTTELKPGMPKDQADTVARNCHLTLCCSSMGSPTTQLPIQNESMTKRWHVIVPNLYKVFLVFPFLSSCQKTWKSTYNEPAVYRRASL